MSPLVNVRGLFGAKHASRSTSLCLLCVCAAGWAAPPASAGGVFNLKADGTGDHPTIQSAIDAADPGDEIVLEGGPVHYTGAGNKNLDFGGKNLILRSTDPADPAVVASTIIDCEFDGRGFHFHSGETRDALVDGLTIIHGRDQSIFGDGGGMIIAGASPTIRRCIIAHCDVNDTGGGLLLSQSDSLLERCTIEDNVADSGAGGIGWYSGSAEIRNCIVRRNRGGVAAGVFLRHLTTARVIGCLIVENGAKGYPSRNGGGMRLNGQNSPKMEVEIRNCTFANNHAEYGGGGLSIYYHQEVKVKNCIFWGNTARFGPQICMDDNPHPTNPVDLWIDYCNVQDGEDEVYEGERNRVLYLSKNIDRSPHFGAGYHLYPYSQCVDAGWAWFEPDPGETDLAGNPRILDGDSDGTAVVDFGAFEFTGICDGPDFDGDGTPDVCDTDIDADSRRNVDDVCPYTPLGTGPWMHSVAPLATSISTATPTWTTSRESSRRSPERLSARSSAPRRS